MNIRQLLGTLFGIGYLPIAPGTWGSFFSLPVIYAVAYFFPFLGVAVFFLTACVLAKLCAPEVQKIHGHDPSPFVMDECAGQSLVFIASSFAFALPGDIWTLATGFLFFRLFDIVKPLGIDNLQKLPGEIGILADDLLAGLYALICLHLSEYIYLAMI